MDGCERADGQTYTVGMYSPGKALVVYEMRRHVWAGNQHAAGAKDDEGQSFLLCRQHRRP